MASFGVHRERPDNPLQQRGTREKQSLGDWEHLHCERRHEKSLIPAWRFIDEEDEEL